MTEKDIPLCFADTDSAYIISKIIHGQDLTRKLVDMGLIPGTEISVYKGGHPGPVIICVKGTRLILGCAVAHKIMVHRK
ncbi:MAG: FeoA family protein [Eubacteriales bacterium]